MNEKNTYELIPKYNNQKSFYGKAHVEMRFNEGIKEIVLYSYNMRVAYIKEVLPYTYKAFVIGWFSNTTGRHIKEFLLQHRFKAENMKQILKDYKEVEE